MDRTPAGRPDQPNAAERFNEEQGTYAVRGADKPDLEVGVPRFAMC
jgi:excinuclease ABC subunit C